MANNTLQKFIEDSPINIQDKIPTSMFFNSPILSTVNGIRIQKH